MSANPLAELHSEITRISDKTIIDKSVIFNLFRLIRLTLDQQKTKRQYSTCSMYCDWIHHLALDQNKAALLTIEKIDKVVVDFMARAKKYTKSSDDPNNTIFINFILSISHALGLSILRRELINLFSDHSLSTYLFTSYSNWKAVATVLAEDLTNKPLAFPENPKGRLEIDSQIIIRRMIKYHRSINEDPAKYINKVTISDERNFCEVNSSKKTGFYLNLHFAKPNKTHGDIIIKAPWGAIEPRAAFDSD